MGASLMQTGNLVIQTLEERLVISVSGNTDASAEILIEDLPFILEFLNTQEKLRMNRRAGFRLNISELPHSDSQLFQLAVLTEAGNITLQPIDISLGGLYAASDTFIGKPGDQVQLLLVHNNVSIALSAHIVRASVCAGKLAFRFINDLDSHAEFEPPQELTTIFAALESCWLGASLDLQWS